MEILKSLGVNSTLWIQLLCFLVSYFALTSLVLKPYMAALREREKRTIGSEEAAVRLIEETTDLHAVYEQKAKMINSKIKSFYDQSRVEATKEYDRLVEAARLESAALLEQSRQDIGRQIQSAKAKLTTEIPAVGSAIASKLAGKEIGL